MNRKDILGIYGDDVTEPPRTFTVMTEPGHMFLVRIVREGDGYGAYDKETEQWAMTACRGELLVEFYDTRHRHTPFGQFITRYYFATLVAREHGMGLILDNGVPSWRLDFQAGRELDDNLADWACCQMAWLHSQP